MNAATETLAKIVAEMRMGDDGGKPAYMIGRPDRYEISRPSGELIRSLVIDKVYISDLADRIEAAAAAMREALEKIAHYTDHKDGMDDPYCADGHILAGIAKKALREGGAE